MSPFFLLSAMFIVVPILMIIMAGIFIAAIIARSVSGNRSARENSGDTSAPIYNQMLDPNNPASPHYLHSPPTTPFDNSPGLDAGSHHHSGGFDGGGHHGGIDSSGGGHH